MATGLQSKFSFAGVAAAGVAAGVGAALGGRLPSLNDNGSAGNIASHLAVGGARLLASAATRSALEGSSFGRNITAGLPDVLAQMLVDSAVGAARRGGGSVIRALADAKDEARSFAEKAELAIANSPELAAFHDPNKVERMLAAEPQADDNEEEAASKYRVESHVMQARGGVRPAAQPRPMPRPPVLPSENAAARNLADLTSLLVGSNIPSQLHYDALLAERARLTEAVQSLGGRVGSRATAPGLASFEALTSQIDTLRFQRAALEFRLNGNDRFLQVEVLRRYQGLIDRGFQLANRRGTRLGGSDTQSRELRLGNFVDRYARDGIRGILREFGVSFGANQHVSVNSRDYSSDRTAWRQPDVRVGRLILDGTIANKGLDRPQIQGYLENRRDAIVITVRPS